MAIGDKKTKLIFHHILNKNKRFCNHLYTDNEENVDFVLKLQFWNGKSMIFVETIRTPGFVKTLFFSLKNNEFFNVFSMKMNDLATFFASSIHREQQKR